MQITSQDNVCGFQTGYIKNIGEKIKENLEIDLNQMYELASSYTLQITETTQKQHPEEPILAVYQNILKRGTPTTCSLLIEEKLTEIPYTPLKIKKLNHSGTIHYVNDPEQRIDKKTIKEWYTALAQALILVDPRILEIHPENLDSKEEERFLQERIPDYLLQLIEPQRKIQTITEKADEFHDQRVDFCIEIPTKKGCKKYIIEIDGIQHTEEQQKKLDEKRDNFLKKQGCGITRIKTDELRQEKIEKLNQIKKTLHDQQYIKLAEKNYKQPLWENDTGKAALQHTLTPLIIARYQDTLLHLLRKGTISIEDKTWTIAVIERDIPFAYLATKDFINYLTNLFKLSNQEIKIPEIKLHTYHSNEFNEFHDFTEKNNQEIEYKRKPLTEIIEEKEVFDIVIDCSILQKTHMNEPETGAYDHILTEDGCLAVIRSSYHINKRGAISKNEPIEYEINEQNQESLKFLLRNIFRKKEFMDGQKKILIRTLKREDTIGLLPTGGGKSLCYQLSGLLQPGITIIIDPLKSLMIDQAGNLRDMGIDTIDFISSDLTTQERIKVNEKLVKGEIQFLFIAPERLQIKEFRNKLKELRDCYLISYVVIDEAHCVSEWGHDFRTAYLNIGRVTKEYCRYKNKNPSIIALTGTASYAVLSDIKREVDIQDSQAIITPTSYDRKELEFNVYKVPSAEKETQLNTIIENLPEEFNVTREHVLGKDGECTFSGIVFCPHVNWKYGVVKVANTLRKRFDVQVKCYSGKAPKNEEKQGWNKKKRKTQEEFKKNKFPMLVSTKAFGMGIDKPNIRYTIHYNIPQSIESFYQEAGRAGRDRNKALCTIIFSDDSYDDARRRLNVESIDELHELPKIHKDLGGDIHRMLFFHKQSFKGTQKETENVSHILHEFIYSQLEGLTEKEAADNIIIPFKACGNENDTEKAIYRLTILGVIEDYTKDYKVKYYSIKIIKKKDDEYFQNLINYTLRYRNPEYENYIKENIGRIKGDNLSKYIMFLIHFICDEIEKKRRRAIQEMADAAKNFSDQEHFRNRIINYFDSKYADKLEHIARNIDSKEWWNILDEINDYDDIQHLLGGCSRTLESYPDHPGLLLLSCYARLFSSESGHELALDDFNRGLKEIQINFHDINEQEQILIHYLKLMNKNNQNQANKILSILLKQGLYENIAKFALQHPKYENNHLMAKIFFLKKIDKNLKTINHLLDL